MPQSRNGETVAWRFYVYLAAGSGVACALYGAAWWWMDWWTMLKVAGVLAGICAAGSLFASAMLEIPIAGRSQERRSDWECDP